jgi:glycosyltransferase involved in cell wall biosynthesis
MAGFDAFAMPSLYEAFPYVLIEAAASGLPLVATPVGGTDALIDHGKNGLIVPHAETNSLTDALESLIAQPELCRHMGIASRRRAAAFTTSAMADATLAVYDQLTRRCQRPLVNDHTP